MCINSRNLFWQKPFEASLCRKTQMTNRHRYCWSVSGKNEIKGRINPKTEKQKTTDDSGGKINWRWIYNLLGRTLCSPNRKGQPRGDCPYNLIPNIVGAGPCACPDKG